MWMFVIREREKETETVWPLTKINSIGFVQIYFHSVKPYTWCSDKFLTFSHTQQLLLQPLICIHSSRTLEHSLLTHSAMASSSCHINHIIHTSHRQPVNKIQSTTDHKQFCSLSIFCFRSISDSRKAVPSYVGGIKLLLETATNAALILWRTINIDYRTRQCLLFGCVSVCFILYLYVLFSAWFLVLFCV